MTAKSVTLPGEDQAFNRKRFVNLHAEMAPVNELAEELVDEVAFQTIRMRRCRRFDTAYLSRRARVAEAEYDDSRKARVEELAHRIEIRCTTSSRRLQEIPEGIDWLLAEWAILRSELTHPDGLKWSHNHHGRSRLLRGIVPSMLRASREHTLTEVVGGFFLNVGNLESPEVEALDDAARIEWARLELLQIVDAEVARLTEARTKLKLEVIAEERAESVDLALFEDSKEANLARKYEAATRRAFYKALDEFREAQAVGQASLNVDSSREGEATSEELGSFGQSAEVEAETDEPESEPVEFVEPEGPMAANLVEDRREIGDRGPDWGRIGAA
jgi:hypothetical protein